MINWFLRFFRKETTEERVDRKLREGGYPPYNDKHLRWWNND